MNKVINQSHSEKGITLIALIVMIVITVTLSAVVISNVGENGLIDVTSEVAENHEITSYREQIEQVVHNTIINYTARGEVPTLIDIADALNDENWVRSAIPNTDEKVGNPDIIVTVDKGYVYQVFYDNTYGKVIVDYLGKVPEGGGDDLIKSLPTIRAKYNKITACIEVEARDEKNGIAKLEFIYKGEIVGTINNPKAKENFDVSKIGTGWYQIKATSNKTGAFRYAWVKVTTVSEALTAPIITLNPKDPDGENNWYKVPVTVTMTTDNPNAKEIHYRIVENGITKPENEDITYTAPVTIETLGTMEIYGWTTDGGEYSSVETMEEVKIDNQAPTAEYTPVSSKEKVGDWYVADVELTIGGKDDHSGLSKYFYREKGQTTWIEKEMADKINVTSEGITEIEIKTKDRAGNESEVIPITIQKDTTKPEKPTIKYISTTRDSITVEGIGNDKESGVASYTFEYKLSTEGSEAWKTLTNATVESTAGKVEYTYTPIAEGEYSLRVKVKDKVNNEQTSDMITQETARNNAPVFSGNPTGTAVTNTNSQISIGAQATDADGDELTYTLWWGTSSDNVVATTMTKTVPEGQAVTFNQTGLSNNTTYYFSIIVTDQRATVPSATGSARTYCKGTYCSGGYYTYPTCSLCGGSGKYGTTSTTCGTCGGSGTHGTTTVTCGTCNGSGKNGTESKTCPTCEGRGRHACTGTFVDIGIAPGNCCGASGCTGEQHTAHCYTCGQSFGRKVGCLTYGTTSMSSMPHLQSVACQTCGQTGTITESKTCGTCSGHGTVSKPTTCGTCSGSGSVSSPKTCTRCGGSGSTTSSHNCSHGYWGSHYHCSTHGNSVSQYH